MSLVPSFELGLWNAWIFVVPVLIISFSDMKVTAAREPEEPEDFQLTEKENKLSYAVFMPMVVSWVYSLFVPLQLDTIWLMSGLITYLFGISFTIVAIRDFATSPKDKVITKGSYSITRNPTYIGLLLMQTGVGIACSSWLHLLLVVVLAILLNANLTVEERYCLHRYGDEYKKYKSKTPRWIGLSKSEKTE